MADHKKTPDILGSLLGGIDPPQKPADQNTIKPEYHNAGTPVSHKASKPVREKRQPATPKVKDQVPPEKVKATFYLDTGAVEDLENGWIELRKLAPKKSRGQISKSLIVELALQMALEDLRTKGPRSSLSTKAIKE